MNNNFQSLLRLFGQSITDPAGAARILTARRYDRQTLWTLLALVSVLSVLLLAVSNLLVPVVVPEEMIVITPMTYGVIIAASLVMLVFALYWVGRMFGGTGHFPETLLLVVWLQVVAMGVQVFQIVVLLILPALAGMVSIAGVLVLLWCMVQFINVLHGYDSIVKSAITLGVAFLGIGFGLAMIVSVIAMTAQAGAIV